MELVRGWEGKFTPDVTGGLQLSKARKYRDIGEEEGLGDTQEGEIRVSMEAKVSSVSEEDAFSASPVSLTIEMGAHEPEVVVEDLMPGEIRAIQQHLQPQDSALGSPFLFCLSRKPMTDNDWEALRAVLPDRYDTWTVTEDVCALSFEVECGIKRWMALNEITQHRITRYRGWVTYSYGTTPSSVEPGNVGDVLEARWLRKNRRYRGQQEYRLAWTISSPQMETFPDVIDIELTKTGLALFKPWNPPGDSPA